MESNAQPGSDDPLHSVITAMVSAAGYDVEEIVVRAAGRHRLIRVIVDSDDGVDLDSAAQLSRDISSRLDEMGDAVMGGAAYTLEITSPGVGRPLTLPRHFRRASGRLVSMELTDGRAIQARIVRATDDTVDVLAGPDGLTYESWDFADIVRAKVEVEFSPPPKAVVELLEKLRSREAAGPALVARDEGEEIR